MNWINTPESSNIARFAYDDDSQVLAVEFNSGDLYQYYDVPQVVFEQMRGAPSKGQYLARNVKGRYRYARV
jgi:hypothetical protein